MIKYDIVHFDSVKYSEYTFAYCSNCELEITIRKKQLASKIRDPSKNNILCSHPCILEFRGHKSKQKVTCKLCEKQFNKAFGEIKRSPNHFCSHSCAATYNNQHKTHGTRRSKLEGYLEEELNRIYPDLEIIYNAKEAINSELDIYIPSLNLAFELNGIFHYEPIYGKDKLEKIQNNDNRKFQACLEKSIEICIIDSSGQKRFTEKSSQKYLDIFINLIKAKFIMSKNVSKSPRLESN